MLREMILETDMDCVAEMETQCFSDPWTPEMILDSQRTGLDTWLILEEEGEASGYCVFRTIAGEAELLRIGVRPPLRGLGYGKKLMDGVVENSRKNGVTAIALEVREGNAPARSLYKSYGFKEECIRSGYYRDPKEDAVIMWNREISNIYH